MVTKEFPPVPAMLLRELKAKFPDTTEGLTTMDALRLRQGVQEVIKFLQSQFNKQNPEMKE